MTQSIFILGGSGYIGQEVIKAAVQSDIKVQGLARSEEAARKISAQGARPVMGDLSAPQSWIEQAAQSKVLINLVQPSVSGRLGHRQMQKIAAERLQNDRRLLQALTSLKPDERPTLFSVSGTDDLRPDTKQWISSAYPLREPPIGFGVIGVPIQKMIEQSGLPAAYLHLGTVYGPGKSFAETVFPQLRAGKLQLPGNGKNHFPIIHVEDAARVIVQLALQDRDQLHGKTFIVTDQSDTTLREFFQEAANLLNTDSPQYVPKWLASLFVGSALVATMTNNLRVLPEASGIKDIELRYPTYHTGLKQTLESLGYV